MTIGRGRVLYYSRPIQLSLLGVSLPLFAIAYFQIEVVQPLPAGNAYNGIVCPGYSSFNSYKNACKGTTKF